MVLNSVFPIEKALSLRSRNPKVAARQTSKRDAVFGLIPYSVKFTNNRCESRGSRFTLVFTTKVPNQCFNKAQILFVGYFRSLLKYSPTYSYSLT